jgi:uncharacterized protein (DUF302 family)
MTRETPQPLTFMKEIEMLLRFVTTLALAMLLSSPALAGDDGVVRVKSGYPMQETIARLKKDVAGKGIMFFQEVDQAKLAADAGIRIRPSTLLVFGNPPLGTLFINSRPEAGLDWPVRLLVQQDDQGEVWAIYTDFGWIAKRHGIGGEAAKPFQTAAGVIASITSSITQ